MPQAASQSTTTRARKHAASERLRLRMEKAVERMLAAAERLIAELDAIEPDPDLEPYLAGSHGDDREVDVADEPHDERDQGDDERSLGWNATHSQLKLGESTDDGDLTAPERAGRGFVRCGPDDAEVTSVETFGKGFIGHDVPDDSEDTHDREAVNEGGGDINDEGEATLGWTEEGSRIGYLGTTYAGEAEVANEDGTDNPDDGGLPMGPEQRDRVRAARAQAREVARAAIGQRGGRLYVRDPDSVTILGQGLARLSAPTNGAGR